MKLPKTACCDVHTNKPAVAKFRYTVNDVDKLDRVCVTCGDIWWGIFGETVVQKTLQIEELTQDDLNETTLNS